MLPHYSPLKVAETFSMLSALFPGRIDLALGRAPGTDPTTTFALQRDRRQPAPDDFPQQLAELLAYLDNRCPPSIRSRGSLPCLDDRSVRIPGCSAHPRRAASGPRSSACPTPLPISSIQPASNSPRTTARDVSAVAVAATPEVMVAVWVICADTDAEADASRRAAS